MQAGRTPAVPRPTPAAPLSAAGTQPAMETDGTDAGERQQQPVPHKTPGVGLRVTGSGAAPATAGPASAAPGSAAHATPAVGMAAGGARSLWLAGPTPTTHRRQQEAAQLLQVAAALDAGRAEALLARAHQVFSDYSVHADGDDKWKAIAGPSLAEALRCAGPARSTCTAVRLQASSLHAMQVQRTVPPLLPGCAVPLLGSLSTDPPFASLPPTLLAAAPAPVQWQVTRRCASCAPTPTACAKCTREWAGLMAGRAC